MARNTLIALMVAIAARNQQKMNLKRLREHQAIKEQDIEEWDELEDVKYDPASQILSFCVRHMTKKPKITRYQTINYQRFPIYEDYSIRSRIEKKFNKTIIPEKFVNKDILQLKVLAPHRFKKILIKAIGVEPSWWTQELKFHRQIQQAKATLVRYQEELYTYIAQNATIKLKETPSSFWARFFFAWFTFGLSFLGYISPSQAAINKEINAQVQKQYDDQVDKYDRKINRTHDKIASLQQQWPAAIQAELDKLPVDEAGWIDLRTTLKLGGMEKLKQQKGVYIIFNQTKAKAYIGQSKNLYQRIFTQHFNKGDVKNIVFAKDWYQGDQFGFKYFLTSTKDELDRLEKKYIDLYNAFETGYNGTSGNR